MPSRTLSPIADVSGEVAARKLPISPLVGEMPGKAEGGAIGHVHREGFLYWTRAGKLAKPLNLTRPVRRGSPSRR